MSSTLELAALLTDLSSDGQTKDERAQGGLLERMMSDRNGQAFTQALTDRVHRPRAARKVVAEVCALLARYGVPRYLSPLARFQLSLFRVLGPLTPDLAAYGVVRRIQRETSSYIIPGDPTKLGAYLEAKRSAQFRVNVNRLGEEVLGEEEAQRHVEGYIALLERADVETISVKISSLYSQVNLLAWASTVATLHERLRRIYRAARTSPKSKLVYLDMESHRDLQLAFELFRSVLDEPEFLGLTAGMVLQAYVPESTTLQRELVSWANARLHRGGAPVRLRVVKGANLAMERVESALRGWPLPTYDQKLHTDANYKRLIEYGTEPEHARAVTLGIASHNVFDLAYGLLLAAARGVENQVGFELLEGMASSTCRALALVTDDILLYGPMVAEAEFNSAIAYLMRRLDENTTPENFLHQSFNLRSDTNAFEVEQRKFIASCALIETVSSEPKRTQDRREPAVAPSAIWPHNEPDTDFSRIANRDWIFAELQRWHDLTVNLPLHIAGEELYREPLALGFDPSRPGYVPYRYSLASVEDIEHAITTAVKTGAEWSNRSSEERAESLRRVAQELRGVRAELIACMVLDAGKRIEEADVEVSEAIDFAEYYAHSLLDLSRFSSLDQRARGVVVVTPPWNFPLAIPLSGVLAALAGGNTVILKPAPETVLVAERAARALWRAGIPKAALQFVVAQDDVASRLVTDPRVNAVILTGATTTARLFRSLRPSLYLCAETGGKNAIIVTAYADRELAIRDLLASAFGHSGQKCSAASLLILEAEVYDDPAFASKLKDAAESLAVGSAWDPKSYVTPLIRRPEGALERGLHTLDPGERWLIASRQDPANPQLYGPAIKYVSPGSYSHTTEFFGPLLSVLRARDLTDAVRIANATPYGLTAGLHSLDEGEQHYFLQHLDAGNLYVNRTITGAIVGRQPFGGRKASSFGPGAKAGGPNYVAQFIRQSSRAATTGEPEVNPSLGPELVNLLLKIGGQLGAADRETLNAVARNYQRAYQETFASAHDAFRLLGQDNLFVYQPCSTLLRIDSNATALDYACSLVAAQLCAASIPGVPAKSSGDGADAETSLLHVSLGAQAPAKFAHWASLAGALIAPSEITPLAVYLRKSAIGRVRVVGDPPEELFRLTAGDDVHVAIEPVVYEGRFELLHYLREQSRSINTHRYGNLGLYEPSA